METNTEFNTPKSDRTGRSGSVDSRSSNSSGINNFRWSSTAFELINGYKHETRIFPTDINLLLNQPNDGNNNEILPRIDPEIIASAVDDSNPKKPIYDAIIQLYLLIHGDKPIDKTLFQAILLSSLAGGVILLPEDLFHIIYRGDFVTNSYNFRKNVTSAWGELLSKEFLSVATTRLFTECMKQSPISIDNKSSIEQFTRESVPITTLILNLEGLAVLAPDSLTKLNDFIKSFYDNVSDAFKKFLKTKNIYNENMSVQDLTGIFNGMKKYNSVATNEYTQLINTCVSQLESYMKNSVERAARLPLPMLKTLAPSYVDTIRSNIPHFIRTFLVSNANALMNFGCHLYLMEEMPEPEKYQGCLICVGLTSQEFKLAYIENGKISLIYFNEKKVREIKTYIKGLVKESHHKYLTGAEIEKLDLLTNGNLPVRNNYYFIAQVEDIRTGTKKNTLMMIAPVARKKSRKYELGLVQIEDILLLELKKNHPNANIEIEDIFEPINKENNGVNSDFYLAIKLIDKNAKKIKNKNNSNKKIVEGEIPPVFAKLIPNNNSDNGAAIIIAKSEELEEAKNIYNMRKTNNIKFIQLYRQTTELQEATTGKKEKLNIKPGEDTNIIQKNTEKMEELKKTGILGRFTHTAITDGAKIIPTEIFASEIYFVTQLINGIIIINNYIKEIFLPAIKKDLPGISEDTLKKLQEAMQQLLWNTFIRPTLNLLGCLPIELYGQIARKKENQMLRLGLSENKTGINYLVFQIFDKFLGGNINHLENFVKVMVMPTKSQILKPGILETRNIKNSNETSSESGTSISPHADISKLDTKKIADHCFRLLLTLRITLPNLPDVNKLLNQLKEILINDFLVKDICCIENTYYAVAVNSTNKNQLENTVAKLVIDNKNDNCTATWEKLTDIGVINAIIEHSNNLLKEDLQFFQISLAAMIKQALPIETILNEINRLNLDISQLVTSPLKFLPQDVNGRYINLIQYAALAKHYEFFRGIKTSVNIKIINTNTSTIVEKMEPADPFVNFVNNQFEGERPGLARSNSQFFNEPKTDTSTLKLKVDFKLMSPDIENNKKIPKPNKIYINVENGIIKYITDKTNADKTGTKNYEEITANEFPGVMPTDFKGLQRHKKDILTIIEGRGHLPREQSESNTSNCVLI